MYVQGADDMWMFLVISLSTIYALQCSYINSMDQYDDSENHDQNQYEQSDLSEEAPQAPTFQSTVTPSVTPNVQRRYWLVSKKPYVTEVPQEDPLDKDESVKDANLKSKIAKLVEQTLHDTERKLRSIQKLKEKHKDEPEYKVGFILSLVKKSRDLLNELFNVAIKHRDDYKALEQLKIFEMIVHTNVDTTNLVRQMVEIHLQYMNSSDVIHHRSRVILL